MLRRYEVPNSKVHGADMGPIWVLSAPGGPHVGLVNLAIRGAMDDIIGENNKQNDSIWG